MAKKGEGFKGFKPHLSSSSNAFARRGDPWVTSREGQQDYDRQVEIENPDMDADRQRLERIRKFSKEFQDRVSPKIDFKMTMREAIETERSVRMDGYQADKAGGGFKPKPKAGQWPKRGKDFEVATVQRRCVNVAMRVRRELKAYDNPKSTRIVSKDSTSSLSARVDDTSKIACPRGCGLSAKDSRLISRHLRKFKNSCCIHSTGCNCPDCRFARNDP